jgi:pimeloyl-ACP methyl ester carboxylesterase
VLLGRTVDGGRIRDVVAVAKHLRDKHQGAAPVHVCGRRGAAILAAYAALHDDRIAGVTAIEPPASHMDSDAPQLLNVLRVCDIPDAFGMLAPRPLTIHGRAADWEKVSRIYSAADARDKLQFKAAAP